jgi:hypothetical protein
VKETLLLEVADPSEISKRLSCESRLRIEEAAMSENLGRVCDHVCSRSDLEVLTKLVECIITGSSVNNLS